MDWTSIGYLQGDLDLVSTSPRLHTATSGDLLQIFEYWFTGHLLNIKQKNLIKQLGVVLSDS